MSIWRRAGESREQAGLVVAGGGTGGHIYPGLAVAGVLTTGDSPARWKAHFVISRRALDAEIVASAGFGATAIAARGFKRRIGASDLLAAWALAVGTWQCWRLLGRVAARIVLAQGGYVSAACALAARLRGIPVVILEANAKPGSANRLAARWAVCSAVAFEGTDLPRPVVTGLPVRDPIAALQQASANPDLKIRARYRARASLGVAESRQLILVVGGSQGAARLNAAVREACTVLAHRGDLAVRHVVGQADGGLGLSAPETPSGGLQYQRVSYEHDMPTALAAADLVISRAGGSALAELAMAGRAGLLVPLTGASHDHQTANAATFAAAGAAKVVAESTLDGSHLAATIAQLIDDPPTLQQMEQAAASFARPQAAQQLTELLLATVGQSAEL